MDERELFQKLLPHCLLICKPGCNHINSSGLASKGREERCAIYFTVTNPDVNARPQPTARVCMCVRLSDQQNRPLCLISNESGISCHYVCPCASCHHKLYRIILPCANHADKVKLDISMGFSCMCSRVVAVCARAHV